MATEERRIAAATLKFTMVTRKTQRYANSWINSPSIQKVSFMFQLSKGVPRYGGQTNEENLLHALQQDTFSRRIHVEWYLYTSLGFVFRAIWSFCEFNLAIFCFPLLTQKLLLDLPATEAGKRLERIINISIPRKSRRLFQAEDSGEFIPKLDKNCLSAPLHHYIYMVIAIEFN